MKRPQPVAKPFCDFEEVNHELVRNEVVNKSSSVGLDEEQFPFSHLDDSGIRQKRCVEVNRIDHMDEEHDSSHTVEGIESEGGSTHSKFETPVKFKQEDLPSDGKESREKVRVISTGIRIPTSNKFAGQELGRMAESLPNMQSHFDELDKLNIHHRLGHSLDTNPKLSKWASVRINHKRSIKSDEGSAHSSSNSECTTKGASDSEELKASDTVLANGNNYLLHSISASRTHNCDFFITLKFSYFIGM